MDVRNIYLFITVQAEYQKKMCFHFLVVRDLINNIVNVLLNPFSFFPLKREYRMQLCNGLSLLAIGNSKINIG